MPRVQGGSLNPNDNIVYLVIWGGSDSEPPTPGVTAAANTHTMVSDVHSELWGVKQIIRTTSIHVNVLIRRNHEMLAVDTTLLHLEPESGPEA